MMGLIIAIHVIICALLIIIILIQAGRGGGLVEGFSNVESMFGPKTNTFLTRTTTTLAILFFLTCISLAVFSARQSRSLMRNVKPEAQPLKEQGAAMPDEPKQDAGLNTGAPKQEVTPAPTPQPPQEKQEAPKAEPRPSSGQNNIQ